MSFKVLLKQPILAISYFIYVNPKRRKNILPLKMLNYLTSIRTILESKKKQPYNSYVWMASGNMEELIKFAYHPNLLFTRWSMNKPCASLWLSLVFYFIFVTVPNRKKKRKELCQQLESMRNWIGLRFLRSWDSNKMCEERSGEEIPKLSSLFVMIIT